MANVAPPLASQTTQGETIELHIPSQLGWERAAMDLAASVARRMGFPKERIEDIKTAVSEATTNAMEHGNRLDAMQKVLIVLVPEEEQLEINVQDQSGQPYVPLPDAPAPSLDDKLAGLSATRGWGMFLIRELVDEVEFTSTARGNQVRMVVHLVPPPSVVAS
jgi:serine/threonine-protein kinase RsbW